MKYVCIGKIVNTHGIKGELRILSSFVYKDKVFKKDFKFYIGKEKIGEVINSYRRHKNFDMVTFNGYNNINEVLKYKGSLVYVNRDDIILDSNTYLDEDLIDLDCYYQDKMIGRLYRVERYPNNNLLVIKNSDKEILIPYHDNFIVKIDLDNKKIYLKNVDDLI